MKLPKEEEAGNWQWSKGGETESAEARPNSDQQGSHSMTDLN
jgi:hypothetical protein